MFNVKKFQKRIEDFTCQNCGKEVRGDGFTNHCPECFFSLHVDIFPGDRLESCHGKMEPVDIESGKGGKYIIIHKCQKCGEISKDKFREGVDNFDNFLKLVEKINQKKINKI
jgi:rubrerythrin